MKRIFGPISRLGPKIIFLSKPFSPFRKGRKNWNLIFTSNFYTRLKYSII